MFPSFKIICRSSTSRDLRRLAVCTLVLTAVVLICRFKKLFLLCSVLFDAEVLSFLATGVGVRVNGCVEKIVYKRIKIYFLNDALLY